MAITQDAIRRREDNDAATYRKRARKALAFVHRGRIYDRNATAYERHAGRHRDNPHYMAALIRQAA